MYLYWVNAWRLNCILAFFVHGLQSVRSECNILTIATKIVLNKSHKEIVYIINLILNIRQSLMLVSIMPYQRRKEGIAKILFLLGKYLRHPLLWATCNGTKIPVTIT